MKRFWTVLILLGVLRGESQAQCDGWESLGGGVTQSNGAVGTATAVIAFENGDLVVGGEFARAGGVPCVNVARWNGAAWQPMGTGLNGHVHALLAMADGSVIAGGEFAGGVRRWNGTSWVTLGGGVSGFVYALAITADGSVVVGMGGSPGVLRWNGFNWVPIGSTNGTVRSLTVLPDGRLVACGDLGVAGCVPCDRIAIWDGSQWSPMGPPASGTGLTFYAATSTPAGDVVAAGSLTPFGGPGLTSNRVWRWRDGAWTELGEFNDAVLAVCALPSGEVLAGGDFSQVGGLLSGRIARWTGTNWASLGSAIPIGRVSDIVSSGGSIVASGYFLSAGGETARGVARASLDLLPTFTSGPASQALLPGGNAVFAVSATGPDPLHYLWQRNGIPLSESVRVVGTATPTLTVSGVTNADQGAYSCVLTADCGGGPVESSISTLSCAPMITTQPVGTALLEPGLTVGVQLVPGGSYTYRWRQNGQNLFNFPGFFSGVTTRTLTIQTTDPSAAGAYDCVITNSCGQVISTPALVYCPTDANRDGSVDGDDVILFFQQWDANEIGADFTGDGAVDGDDVIGFFGRWDVGC